MDPNLLEMYAQAQAALAKGVDPAALDREIARVTGGSVTGFAALQAHVERRRNTALDALEARPSDAVMELSASGARGQGALGDYATLAANDALLGFTDEMIGSVAPNLAQRMRDRVRVLRETAPVSAQLGAGAPAMLLPAGPALNAMRTGGLFKALAVGGAAGATAGAAHGFGEGEGSFRERAPGAALDTAVGATTGAVLGPLGRVGQRAISGLTGSRNARIARGLARAGGDPDFPVGAIDRVRMRLTGSPRLNTIPSGNAIEQQLITKQAQRGAELFDPFQQQPVPQGLRDFVNQVRGTGFRSTTPDRVDFESLRTMHNHLRDIASRNPDRVQALDARKLATRMGEELEVAFPGYQEARRQYAMVSEELEAFRMAFNGTQREGQSALEGIAGWTRPSALRAAMQTWQENPAAQNAARQGMRHRLMDDLLQTRQGVVGSVRVFMDAEQGTKDMIREMFIDGVQGDRAFEQFMRVVREEAGDATLASTFRDLTRAGLTAAAFGAGAGAVSLSR